MPDQIFTAAEAAEMLGQSAETIHRWRREGLLKPHKTMGRMAVYSLDALHELVDHFEAKHQAEIAEMRRALNAAARPIASVPDDATADPAA